MNVIFYVSTLTFSDVFHNIIIIIIHVKTNNEY